MKRGYWIVFLFLIFGFPAQSQIHYSGVVKDMHDSAMKGVRVEVTHTDIAAVTDEEGIFSLVFSEECHYEIRISQVGYLDIFDSLFIAPGTKDQLPGSYRLQSYEALEGLTVLGKSREQQKREEPIKAIVLDTRAYTDRPSSLAELMNRSPGVRIRQSGGVGNAVDVSINGFQGNSVQYFRDGIPLEYLGGGYTISNVPTNLLQSVEVYKGVIPVSLGADALGGAVNLVTRTDHHSYLNASYEIGSFNTHILHLSGYYQNQKNTAFTGGHFFYNYSDNDYRADVTVTDPVTANPVDTNVRLFHNSYRQYFGEVYAGIKNRTWTDELRMTVSAFSMERASQHPALMTVPYGAVMMYSRGWAGSLRYQKSWMADRLTADQFITYSYTNRSRVDTLHGTYDWFGTFTPRASGVGESPRPSFSDIDFNALISRTHLRYMISGDHHVELNVVYNYNHRLGSDPYGLRFQGTDIDVLSKDAIYAKTVAGLAYESGFLDKKLTNQFQLKYFSFSTKGINGFLAINTDLDDYITVSSHHWGIGDAIKYQINDRSFIRASAELTYRLPSQLELFGDNDTRAPNFELKPERSLNIQLGYNYRVPGFNAEVSTFYRNTSGMIMLVPIQPPFAQYTNLDSIRGFGLDFDINYEWIKGLWLTGNFSWQENRMVHISNALYSWMNGTRLRNTPFFFGNAGAAASYKDLFMRGDLLKPYAHYNFIREFYLNHVPRELEPDGFLGIFGSSGVPVTNVIPDQHLVNVGFTYGLPVQGWTIGLEVKNLLDEDLYDYYKIQRAGRSFHFKINYLLTYINNKQ